MGEKGLSAHLTAGVIAKEARVKVTSFGYKEKLSCARDMSRMIPIYTIYSVFYTPFGVDVRHRQAVWPSCWEHCWDLCVWDLCIWVRRIWVLDIWFCGSVGLWISGSASGSLHLWISVSVDLC